MPLAGPFVHLDYAATPTEADDVAGGTVLVYPPLAGVFAICDLDTFAQSAELLTPFRVYPVPAQSVLAGDDPADPQATVTLHFADEAEAGPVFEAVAALPPVPSRAPYTPAPPDVGALRIPRIDFARLLTLDERVALNAARAAIRSLTPADYAAPGNEALVSLEVVLESFELPAEFIELNHPETVLAVETVLVAAGILTPARAAAVLAGVRPG